MYDISKRNSKKMMKFCRNYNILEHNLKIKYNLKKLIMSGTNVEMVVENDDNCFADLFLEILWNLHL